MNLEFYTSLYKNQERKSDGGPIRKSRRSTHKWVELKLHHHELSTYMMQTRDFTTKVKIMELLEVIDRKIRFYYRQEDFDLQTGSTILQAALRGTKK